MPSRARRTRRTTAPVAAEGSVGAHAFYDEGQTDPPGPAAVTEDRGSFTHGICDDCGWSGPGRRARAAAARDAVRHLQTGCAGRVTSAAAHPAAAR
jgi:hypothetical protein